ncbi:gfo/Idh/MocA family oxidoreductase [Cohnella sp. CFH 77786]|uniref:Gfo/Idh/MocA family protein n=1 Tax=Cohnella sp. CFH 77786 TaxID=2662265 RepID=UPI001C609B77|nr:Gfo/Idh/MocA family oxidoreductase [Cohnella sp. CFH 77786]MBW5446477.1 gfo/Idh/MocA family oxidoreductase [Cohnella sp. CFH 77786]
MTSSPLKVGIIGQGRSGRDIHGKLLVQLPGHYRVAAIADALPERRERARKEFDCNTYETWEGMVDQEQLDLVVNASPSHLHYPISLELLNRGMNVLCEKPLAKTPEEVDQLIAASERSGKLLAVFQQSRYHPAFQQIRRVIDSGVLGRIVQVDISLNGFARRWDWQTLQSNNGGNLMNTGPHPVDQALQLFGTDAQPQITCIMDRANTFGDAEDYVKLLMRGPGRPVIDIEISSCCAYPQDAFNIQGTNGGLHGSSDFLEWLYFKPEEAPPQQLVKEPLINADGLPAYCSETLTWHSDTWTMSLPEGQSLFEHMTERLYLMLHHALTTGAPLEITPEQVRLQMWVMEECRRQNPHIYTGESAVAHT